MDSVSETPATLKGQRFSCLKHIKTVFKYIDEHGDITELSREVDSDHLGLNEGDILCEIFRDFFGTVWIFMSC